MTFDDADDRTIDLGTVVVGGKEVIEKTYQLEKWASDFRKWFLMEICDSRGHLERRFSDYKGADTIRKVVLTTSREVLE